jgi:hypothetical protein
MRPKESSRNGAIFMAPPLLSQRAAGNFRQDARRLGRPGRVAFAGPTSLRQPPKTPPGFMWIAP